jgi:hypothetical protein
MLAIVVTPVTVNTAIAFCLWNCEAQELAEKGPAILRLSALPVFKWAMREQNTALMMYQKMANLYLVVVRPNIGDNLVGFVKVLDKCTRDDL